MHIYVVRYRNKGTAFFWNMQTFWHIFYFCRLFVFFIVS